MANQSKIAGSKPVNRRVGREGAQSKICSNSRSSENLENSSNQKFCEGFPLFAALARFVFVQLNRTKRSPVTRRCFDLSIWSVPKGIGRKNVLLEPTNQTDAGVPPYLEFFEASNRSGRRRRVRISIYTTTNRRVLGLITTDGRIVSMPRERYAESNSNDHDGMWGQCPEGRNGLGCNDQEREKTKVACSRPRWLWRLAKYKLK